MTKPTRAMVLAAGLGQRMRPITDRIPKPLVKVGGQSMLDHALDRLEAAGVEQAVVNTHWLADQILTHLDRRAQAGRGPVTLISPEPELLETAGGIKRALPLLGDQPFFAVNSDILWLDGPTPALERLTRNWDPERMDVLLLLAATVWTVGYDGSGDFHMDPAGRLSWRTERQLAPFVYAGVQIAKPELFRDLPDGPLSNKAVWQKASEEGRLFGLRHDGPWYHVGTPEAIPQVDAQIRQPAVRWVEP
ncbi:nucleotidyltransferase family protein [Indioceanicola profundi]|uniref:nucleotidyltransferase family protein n=1 Tax=Indioceanicola profundi TaxID=2220096 RepID=UPI000E6ADE96|nr:nucleotidyltransferase family protein [Indioceanicola profundi]